MKQVTLLLIALVMMVTGAAAQIYSPVKWSVASKKISAKEAVLFIRATIQDGWHIYGLNVPDGGPISTSFTFPASKEYTLKGKAAAPAPLSKFEKDFNMNVPYYTKEVTFQQRVIVTGKQTTVKGSVEFMACDQSQCLPPDEYEFSIVVK